MDLGLGKTREALQKAHYAEPRHTSNHTSSQSSQSNTAQCAQIQIEQMHNAHKSNAANAHKSRRMLLSQSIGVVTLAPETLAPNLNIAHTEDCDGHMQ